MVASNEFMVDSSIDGSQIFASRVIAVRQDVGALVEAVGEGHHGNIDEALWYFGRGQAVETRVDGMIKNGAVLHGEAVDKVLKIVLGILVEQAERHGVKITVEPHDAEIKAFLGWSVVFSLGFSATGEGGERDNKCQHGHR